MAQPLSTPLPLPTSSGCLVGFEKSGYVVDNIFAGDNLHGQSLLAVGMFE
jgi:hypothetical protein